MNRVEHWQANDQDGAATPEALERIAQHLVEGSTLTGAAPLRGLALSLATPEGAETPLFDILGIDARDEVACRLGQFHEEEVVAIWRRMGADSGLALMLHNEDGSLLEPYPQVGAVQLGRTKHRRRHGLLRERRPRFLTRRKTGRSADRPLVHREREIFSGARG
ncbi:MAG: hypothetical protein JJU21_10415 [Salinarimonas sp.]|nr:hypothetical protein [Salinarimonas sp.]